MDDLSHKLGSVSLETPFKKEYSSLSSHRKLTKPVPGSSPKEKYDPAALTRYPQSIENPSSIKHSKANWGRFARSTFARNARVSGAGFLDNPDKFSREQRLASDLMFNLEEEGDETQNGKVTAEDLVVPGLKVSLLPHQVHGLRFLTAREEDISCKGGLLCDDMGLGKTIQILALMLKNPSMPSSDKPSGAKKDNILRDRSCSTIRPTLVVCPLALASQWSQEITKKAPGLTSVVFHGRRRTADPKELLKYDVVITTYDTVRSEREKTHSALYILSWWRVVLDEAHTIQNSASKTAKATFALASHRRWCLTGTPIQNNVEGLQALFIFLKYSKFSDSDLWKTEIHSTIVKGAPERAINLLRNELRVVMLRRTKAVLQNTEAFSLPPKTVQRVLVHFSPAERAQYRRIETRIVDRILRDIVVDSGDKVDVICYMVYLLRLRQIACHWKLLQNVKAGDVAIEEKFEDVIGETTGVMNDDTSTSKSPEEETGLSPVPQSDDLSALFGKLKFSEKECTVCCAEIPATMNTEGLCAECFASSNPPKEQDSAKTKRLLEILSVHPKRKTIVFSQFTSMLDLLEPVLARKKFKFVRYDGAMSRAKRDEALEILRNDPSTTILLCSLKCGALGLNLTCASRVVLFDPWWNPQVSEQAIDRVYRLGQTSPVDVYELVVVDSVEERIIKLQDIKRALAKAVTDGDKSSQLQLLGSKLSTDQLLGLFGVRQGTPIKRASRGLRLR